LPALDENFIEWFSCCLRLWVLFFLLQGILKYQIMGWGLWQQVHMGLKLIRTKAVYKKRPLEQAFSQWLS
jgi:hypothetical protein